MDFIGKKFDGLKFICGYLITLCSIILLLIIYKTSRASKSGMGLGCYMPTSYFQLQVPNLFTQTL